MQRVSTTDGLALLALAGPRRRSRPAPMPQPTAELEPVVVIGTSPLPGQGIDRDLLPYGTQVIRRERIDASKPLNLVDYLNRSVPGVQVNEITGNPYQGDLTYRGFRASPLLGAGQGLSVYLDGVRINEPFGDVVNFDLIPEFAVRSISLVPGANPAFGLNSLGGALAYTTYDGRSAPGLRAELSGGSFGRGKLSLSYGRSGETAGTSTSRRPASPKTAGATIPTATSASFSARSAATTARRAGRWACCSASSKLIGNGLVPAYTFGDDGERVPDLYQNRREAIYTHPDETKNRLEQLSFNLQHALDAAARSRHWPTCATPARHRQRRRGGRPGRRRDRRRSTPPARARPAMAAGLSYARESGAHQWQVGATVDTRRCRLPPERAAGFFDDTRGVQAAPGSEAADLGRGRWQVAPASASMPPTPGRSRRAPGLPAPCATTTRASATTLTSRDDDTGETRGASARALQLQQREPGAGHRAPARRGGELADAVCERRAQHPRAHRDRARLRRPGGALPPAGRPAVRPLPRPGEVDHLRGSACAGRLRRACASRIEAYRTDNRDDILFQSVDTTSQLGFFANFPKTRNQGIDAQLSRAARRARHERGLQLPQGHLRGQRHLAPGRAQRGGDARHAHRGAAAPHLQALGRLASRPRAGRSAATCWPSPTAACWATRTACWKTRSPAKSRRQRASSIPGYAIFNLRASWKPAKDWELYVAVNNVFDRRYETFGALAETVFSADGRVHRRRERRGVRRARRAAQLLGGAALSVLKAIRVSWPQSG